MTEIQYVKFLTEVYLKRDGSHLDKASVDKYSRQAIGKINKYLTSISPLYKSLFEVETLEELYEIRRLLCENQDFVKENNDGHQMYSAGLNRYIQFAEGTLFRKFNADISIMDVKEPIPELVFSKDRTQYRRDSLKVSQAKGACNYSCQIDKRHETFESAKDGRHFVEAHHIIPLSCQGEFPCSLDVHANIIVLCPNCHRLLHYAIKQTKRDRLYRIYDDRYERFEKTGILVDRNLFVEMASC